MLPEITGGGVRYDKIAFVLFPVGSPGFLRFLRFQTVTGGLRADIAQKVALQFLFLPDSGFQPFQPGKGRVCAALGLFSLPLRLPDACSIAVEPEPQEPEETEQPQEDEPKSSGMGGLVVFLVVALIGGGAALYFFKFKKPKADTKGGDDLDEYDFGEDEDDEDEPTPEDEEPAQDKEE